MANAVRDENRIPVLIGTSAIDGITSLPVYVDATSNALYVYVKTSELPSGASTEDKQLPDNHRVTVSNIASTPVITGFATSAKQDNQVALETTLNSLIETIQEYSARVAALSAVITSGLPTLRVSGAVTATGGGYVTSAQVIAALLTQTKALEQYSANAVHSNINNVNVGVS